MGQEQSSVASALLSSFIEATTDQTLMSPTEMAEEDCDKLPVYLYWSELYKNSVYIPHNQSPPSSYKSYVLIDKMFSFYWQDCEKKGNVVLFQCRTEENDDYADSILSESPDFECTDRTGYTFKEPIGRCFANKNDAEGLVALHKYYHDGPDAHFYTTDKDDVDLDECKYEGIMCYVYPSEQTEQSLFSSIPSTVSKNDLLKVAEQESQSNLDLIFILDSSGSVAFNDDEFLNWQAEIDYAAATVRKWAPSRTA